MRRTSAHPGPPQAAAWRAIALLAACLLATGRLLATGPAGQVLGLPFTRFYPYEEIGNATRGSSLSFDALGRIAVIHDGSCLVLNDNTWLEIGTKQPDVSAMQRFVCGPDGQAYYGSFGSWGAVEVTPDGRLRQRPLVPKDYPKWVLTSDFTEIAVLSQGVYFAGFNGVAFWNRSTGHHTFFAVPEVARMFTIGERVFVSSHQVGMQELDPANGSWRPLPTGLTPGVVIDRVTRCGPDRVLFSTHDGRLRVFDGREVRPWSGPLAESPLGRVTAMQQLVDGTIALAINGQGLYLLSEQGEIQLSLTTPDYHRVTDLANREPGVLWVATENGIEKVLYESPLTMFSQRLGLPVSWPQVVRWRDEIVVASAGRIYHSLPGRPGETSRFQLVPGQPKSEIWGIAAREDQLLVGSTEGVVAAQPTGGFAPVLPGFNAARLALAGDNLCFAIGTNEIAVLRWDGQRWAEAAPRIPGVGYPFMVHTTRNAVWIELGANRCARLVFRDGALQLRLFEQFPWPTPRWVNIGAIDDTVVLSALPGGRLYFDERTEQFTDAPKVRQLLDQAPQELARFEEGPGGIVWATFDQGLAAIRRNGGTYKIDTAIFLKMVDSYPAIQVLWDGDVWLTTGHSLYHVNQRFGHELLPAYRPTLVSAVDGRTGRPLSPAGQSTTALPELSYAENSLHFQFFAGSYGSRRTPTYEFVLHRGVNRLALPGNGSTVTLTDLREGRYRLDVRLLEGTEPLGPMQSLEFVIAPPWFRTWYAVVCYLLGAALALAGLLRWSARRTRQRTLALEQLVQERTLELRHAMEKLNEEARNAATVAERNRLAGEIHDSLQQGLSGLMLQLDSTLKLPDLPADVRSRLMVARNMVSFTRHEVQHAVWDMETPLLEGTELGEALRKIIAFIDPGTARFELNVEGTEADLSSSTKHHLLRIAQEAITNAVRHSAASTIRVRLAHEPERVTLSVADDGNGFVPDDVLTRGLGHFGLRGLRGRAAKIGGEVQIESAPGRGTVVTVVVRLPAPAYSHADVH